MDFGFTEEQQLLRQTVRRFVNENLIPLEDQFRGVATVAVQDADVLNESLRDKARALGLWNMGVPKEYGGQGLNAVGQVVVHEETARAFTPGNIEGGIRLTIPGILFSPSITEDPEMRAKYLDPVLRGEKRSGFLQTEPQSGSDPASIETKAVLDGDEWVITGDKGPVGGTRGVASDFYHVVATVDKAQHRSGIGAFLVDSDSPGFEYVRNIPLINGISAVCQISLHDVRVPKKNAVVEPGQSGGWAAAQGQLGLGRMNFGVNLVGKGERAIEMAIKWAKQRITFGQPIASRQAIQWMLADSAIDIEAMRNLNYRGAWMVDQGDDIRQIAAINKVFAAEAGQRVSSRVIQIFGAAGMSDDLPVGRWWVMTRHWAIGEGSVEMMRFIISRNMLRD
jgi:acyl-CoA dehydrogenase